MRRRIKSLMRLSAVLGLLMGVPATAGEVVS
jgi:hypothetical protein